MIPSRLTLPAFLILTGIVPALHTSTAFALPPPWARFSLNSGTTDNLFADSLNTGDQYAGLSLDLEQSLAPFLSAFYGGSLRRFAETTGLGTTNQDGGLDAGFEIDTTAQAWSLLRLKDRRYGSDYAVYDNRGYSLSAGIDYVPGPSARWRAMAEWARAVYPNLPDSVALDYDDLRAAAGVNLSLTLPAALDLEAGLQRRTYRDLQPTTTTLFGYFSARLSGPLGPSTGVAVNLLIREQASEDGEELTALYLGGISPGDLLWNGWNGGVTVTRYYGPWRARLGANYGDARYAETEAITGRPPRRDIRRDLSLSLRRALPLQTAPLRLVFSLEYLFSSTTSTDSFYSFTGQSLSLALALELE